MNTVTSLSEMTCVLYKITRWLIITYVIITENAEINKMLMTKVCL